MKLIGRCLSLIKPFCNESYSWKSSSEQPCANFIPAFSTPIYTSLKDYSTINSMTVIIIRKLRLGHEASFFTLFRNIARNFMASTTRSRAASVNIDVYCTLMENNMNVHLQWCICPCSFPTYCQSLQRVAANLAQQQAVVYKGCTSLAFSHLKEPVRF